MSERAEEMAADLRRLADIIEQNPTLEVLLRDSMKRLTMFPEHYSVDTSSVVHLLIRDVGLEMDFTLADPAFEEHSGLVGSGSVVLRVMSRRAPVRLATVDGVPA